MQLTVGKPKVKLNIKQKLITYLPIYEPLDKNMLSRKVLYKKS